MDEVEGGWGWVLRLCHWEVIEICRTLQIWRKDKDVTVIFHASSSSLLMYLNSVSVCSYKGVKCTNSCLLVGVVAFKFA